MNIWRCQKEESKLLTLKGLPVWSGETDTSKSVEGTLSTSAGVSAMEEIGQRCQGWSGRASWRGRRLSQAQEGRERAALRTSKCWEEGAGTGAYKEGPCRWAWEAQGGRCGWSQREEGVGSGATAVREAERAGPCEPQATPILTLCEAWAIGELGGGRGDTSPEAGLSAKEASGQNSAERSPSLEHSEFSSWLSYLVFPTSYFRENKRSGLTWLWGTKGPPSFLSFVAQDTQKSLKDLPTVINWNNGGERARGQAPSFKPCGTHLTRATSKGGRALPREARHRPPPPPAPCPGGLAGAAAWDRVLSSPQDSEWEPRTSGGWEITNKPRGSALWTAEGC